MPETATPPWAALAPNQQETLARHVQILRERLLRTGGAMPFAEFMDMALYDPQIGYYAHETVFGGHGDFVTAPTLSPLFGQCVARQCAQILRETPGVLVEAGGGTGRLAVDMLRTLESLEALPSRYVLIERSARRREEARTLIGRELPDLAGRILVTDTWPAVTASVIVANELLDALPAERFRVHGGQAHPLSVGADDEGLGWRVGAADARLTDDLATAGWPEGYTSEISWNARRWVADAASHVCEGGLLLLVDYGFPATEYYHPQRADGTLMCHFRHHAHSDPLILPGLQDITVHVDFTAMADAGRAAGLALAGYTSQAGFLLSLGIAPRTLDFDRAHREDVAAIKRLTLPHEMGELFKVMALTRGETRPLAGFHLLDRRAALGRR